ncbi:MAG: tyrosine-type recombinase/integrase [Pseudomonadota bacterium]|jgi:integrase
MSLPSVITIASDAPRVWLRISAFLSLKSPATRVTYSGILTEWCAFLGAKAGTPESAERIVAATDLHAIAYRKYLETRPGERPRFEQSVRAGVTSSRAVSSSMASGRSKKKDGLEATQSNATIHKKFAALRRIYRMLVASNLGITENPFEADKVPPPPKDAGRKRPTQMIDFELVMEIISQPDEATAKGRRDRAILAVLFGGGIRRSELVALRIADVRKTSSGTTFLYLRHTKAKRDAEQALPDWAAAPLWELIAERKRDKAADGDYLFVGFTGRAGQVTSGKPISDTGVYILFKKYCNAAGAGAFATPHSARATAITKLLADGIPHREVQEFSRHASIQMVEWYDKRRFDVEQSPARGLNYYKKPR